MNTRALLTNLGFNPSQIDIFTKMGSNETLEILKEHHRDFTALGFDNTQILKLATSNDGIALSIILNKIDQFPDLYSETVGFTAHDVFAIAKVNPRNLEILFDNKFFVGSNEILTTNYFVECLSGNQAAVEQLQQSISAMVRNLVSYYEPEVIVDSDSHVEEPELIHEQTSPEYGDVEALFEDQLTRELFGDFDEINNPSETPSLTTSLNLVYTNRNHVAKVITKNQLNEIQTDEAGNLYVMERNTKMMVFAGNSMFEKIPSLLFKSMNFCFDKNDQFIGVVFNSNLERNPVFTPYYVIKGGTLADWLRGAASKRQAYLHEQFLAAQDMCKSILHLAGIQYKPIHKRTVVFSHTVQVPDSETVDTTESGPEVKKAKSSHQIQTSYSTQATTSSTALLQTFLSGESIETNNNFETAAIVAPTPPMSRRGFANMPSSISPEITDVTEPNLNYTIPKNVAKVITQDQHNRIQKDKSGNIYIMENGVKLVLLNSDYLAKNREQPSLLFAKIRFCLDADDNFVGVVFNTDDTFRPQFANYRTITGRTWMDWVNTATGERQKKLIEQLYIARGTCKIILAKAGLSYAPVPLRVPTSPEIVENLPQTISSRNYSTTEDLQRVFLPSIGSLEPQPYVPDVTPRDTYAQMPSNTPWFLSRSIGTQTPVIPPPEDLIFHDTVQNHVATVIKPDHVNDIQTDESMNIFVYKNNLRLSMLPADLIRTKQISEIVKKIYFCIDANENFVGVVFKSHSSTKPRFPHCEVIMHQTLMGRITHAKAPRKDKLIEQLKIGETMCATILAQVDIEFTPGNKNRSVSKKTIITHDR